MNDSDLSPLPVLGGWGRLLRVRPGRSSIDETGERLVAGLAAETAHVAVRDERHVRTAPGRTLLARSHATLSFLDQGTYAVNRDGRFLLADPLSVGVFAPFAAYEAEEPEGWPRGGLSVFLSDDVFFGLLPSAVDRAWPAVVPASMATLVLEQAVRRVVARRRGAEALEEAVEVLWTSVRRDLASASVPRPLALRSQTIVRHERAVARARTHLVALYRHDVAIADVARAAYVSVFYLARIFRRATGFTLHGYLKRLRVRAALPGIADRRVPLDEVAAAVGYTSPSYFARVVREATGLTPRELRQMIAATDPATLSTLVRQVADPSSLASSSWPPS